MCAYVLICMCMEASLYTYGETRTQINDHQPTCKWEVHNWRKESGDTLHTEADRTWCPRAHLCSVVSSSFWPYGLEPAMGSPRQESWSGLPFPPPGIFLTQGLNQRFLHLLHWQVDSFPRHHLGRPCYPHWVGNLRATEMLNDKNSMFFSILFNNVFRTMPGN